MDVQPELPCSDEELLAAIEHANGRRLLLETAQAEYQAAVARRTAALRSRGVVPS